MNFEEPAAHAPVGTFREGALARIARPRISIERAKVNRPPRLVRVEAIRREPRHRITVRWARHAPTADTTRPASSCDEASRRLTRVA